MNFVSKKMTLGILGFLCVTAPAFAQSKPEQWQCLASNPDANQGAALLGKAFYLNYVLFKFIRESEAEVEIQFSPPGSTTSSQPPIKLKTPHWNTKNVQFGGPSRVAYYPRWAIKNGSVDAYFWVSKRFGPSRIMGEARLVIPGLEKIYHLTCMPPLNW